MNVLELFAGSARFSGACAHEGLMVGQPVDLRLGFDLNTKDGQARAWTLIQQQNPEVVFMAPVCTPWSPLRNIAPLEVREAERKIMLPMVKFCVQVALYQKSKGRFFIIENPENSAMWNQEDMAALAALVGSNWAKKSRHVLLWPS